MAELMAEILGMHSQLGVLRAEIFMIKCGDPNSMSNEFQNKDNDFIAVSTNVKRCTKALHLLITDDEKAIFSKECDTIENAAMYEHEIVLEKEHRPTNLVYNIKAIINKTDRFIPEDILIGLSYGWKFLFPYVATDRNIHEVLAQMEVCIEDSIPELAQHEAFSEVSRILNRRRKFTLDPTIQWLRFLAHRTNSFFKLNEDLMATRSDKGAHTVIIACEDYDNAIGKMLDETGYITVNESPLKALTLQEEKIVKFFKTNHKTKAFCTTPYEPETKQLAKFYALPKVHKKDFCLRPITAMSGAPGHLTGKVFNTLLNDIFPITHFHIRDCYMMVELTDRPLIHEHDILVSFDVVSMYTNIPRKLVIDIIRSKQKEIFARFGISEKVLMTILDFILAKTTVFTALDKIYQQIEGLPMGGCVSTTLARIVMDRVAEHLLINEPDISLLRIFVDDTVAALRREKVQSALTTLNNFHPSMKFTCEIENARREINFLNLTLKRDGNFITCNWYRKCFASGRLLPYYSSHKRTTIMGTAQTFIQTVLRLSDEFFFSINKPLVERTLRDNGFPVTTIMALMNDFYTLMKKHEPKEKKEKPTYRIYPYAVCESRRIKRVLTRLCPNNVIYAESTKNTKINFVRTRKTRTPWPKRSNVILSSECDCGSKVKYTATKFNETGEIAALRIITKFHNCENDLHAFNEVKYHRGCAYRRQTGTLLKYLQYRDAGRTLDRQGCPNHAFARILRDLK